MRFFAALLFILLLPWPVSGEKTRSLTSYYHYDGKPIYLRKHSFRRYVLPQLKGMSQDWRRLLIKLNPLHEDLIALRKKSDELSMAWAKAHSFCRIKFSQECGEWYRKAHDLGRKVDLIGLNFQEKEIRFQSSGKKKGVGVERMMELSENLGKILRANYSILHYLEQGLIEEGSRGNLHRRLERAINPLIKDLNFFSNAVTTAFLPDEERKMFDFVWDNFFYPLDVYAVKKGDKEYLLRHLEELNIAWHTFHMKLTKGLKKQPRNVKVYFTTMNKRWNSILKTILHTTKGDGS